MFSWQAELQTTAQHLLLMANTPGFQDHARLRRDRLLSDPMWSGLREELTRLQREAKESPCT